MTSSGVIMTGLEQDDATETSRDMLMDKSLGATSRRMTMEELYMELGDFGRYQWRVFILVAMLSILSAESVGMNFVAGHQDHWCFVNELQSLSYEQQKAVAIPQDKNGKYTSCMMFQRNYSTLALDEILAQNNSLMSIDTARVPCTSWVYDKSRFVSTLTSRFNLVCDKTWLRPLVTLSLMLGFLVGSGVSGYLSDRFGRKKALYASLVFKIVTISIAPIPINIIATCILKFFVGVGNIGLYIIGFVYLMEFVTVKWRRTLGLAMAICYAVGFMIWPFAAFFIRDDIKLQYAMAAPNIIFIIYWWCLDETPCWLLEKENYNELNSILRKIASVNKKHLPDGFDAHMVYKTKPEKQSSCTKLFVFPRMRMRTITIYLYWFSCGLMYYVLSLNTGRLFGNIYVNTFISGLVEIPFTVLCICLMGWEVTGRRITCSGAMILSGIASAVSAFMIAKDVGIAHSVFAAIAKGFVTLGFNGIYLYSSEIFPTEVRTFGVGSSSMCARIAGVLAPYFGAPLGNVWGPLPALLCGCIALLSGCLLLTLPETLHAPLCTTLEEAEEYDRSRSRKKVQGDMVLEVQ